MASLLPHAIRIASTDPSFRSQVLIDVEAALTAQGLSLTGEERALLARVVQAVTRHTGILLPTVGGTGDGTSGWNSGPSFTLAALGDT